MPQPSAAGLESRRTDEGWLMSATAQDAPWITSLLQEGARERAFEPALADPGEQSELFFARLQEALVTGTWPPGRAEPARQPAAVHGFVYASHRGGPPLGFAILKGIPGTLNELWLIAVEPAARHTGVGKAMLRAVLATAPGRTTCLARVNVDSAHADAIVPLLLGTGFACERTGAQVDWYVHRNAPNRFVEFVRSAPLGSAPEL